MPRFFLFLFGATASVSLWSQVATAPEQVKRVFVGTFGDGEEGGKIRRSLVEELSRSRKFKIVDTPSAADATLTGSGSVWIKGHYSMNPRAHEVGEDTHPMYGGYLSVELQGRDHDVLWSYLVTPRRYGPEDIGRNLADQIVKKLASAVGH